ncbi:S-adenosylmethionine decarboxylase family protein [Chitinophaga solisilvae]|uniref:S-adenosylmethionine decarboxylase family protein n=1 Tax=Chitinophaga solisilvae TaxID=1233460 RepID=UPI00136B1831|nr:S-adenosylmethionine decarboxylase [Chitinophaga solisilvae]
MEYKPGLHLLATLYTQRTDLLQESSFWNTFIQAQITSHQLTAVGHCVHDFPGGGFTGVHCLTESHISIHTWPEFNLCTCDIFLSNFSKNNDAITTAIMEQIQQFFEATPEASHCIRR